MGDRRDRNAAHDPDALALAKNTLALVNRFAYATSNRSHSHEFREVTGIALTTSAVRLLEHLNGRSPTPISTVAQDLGLDLSRTSRLTRDLSQSGYLVRTPDPDDPRRTLIRLDASAQPAMDRWLSAWTGRHLEPVRNWPEDDIAALAAWFRLVHGRLIALLPERPESTAPARWRVLTTDQPGLTSATREFAEAAIDLYSWVAQARWFDTLLSGLNVDLAQQHYFTLRVVAQRGPLPVADVAERSGVDHTQASKRLKRLEELRLAERGTDSFDRRSTLFRCTRRGTTLERRIVSTQIGVLEEAIYPVSTPGDRKQWSELVIRYRAAMERAGAQFEI